MRLLWLFPLLSLLFGGCRPPASGPVQLEKRVPFHLREPADGPRMFSTHYVVFQLPDGQEERLVTTLENDANHMCIVASSPMGQTLFTLQLRQGTVTLDARVPLPKTMDPRLLLALVQLANWPLEDVRKGLEGVATLEDEGVTRILRRKERIVLSLKRDGLKPPFKVVALEIPSASIRAVITTLEELP